MLPPFRVTVQDGTHLPEADGLTDDQAYFDCDRVHVAAIGQVHHIVGFKDGRPRFSVIAGKPEADMQDHILPATMAWLVQVYAPASGWMRVYAFAGSHEFGKPQ